MNAAGPTSLITAPEPTNSPAPMTPPIAIIVRWRCFKPLCSSASGAFAMTVSFCVAEPERAGSGLLVRVGVAYWRVERLLDRPRAGPALDVEHRAGLVVGARRPAAPEGLPGDDRAGGPVVDVEVARGVPQRVVGLLDRGPVRREDGAGQRVRAGAVDEVERRGVRRGFRVVVDVHGEDRAEVLGGERLVGRVGADQDGGLDEPTLAVVGAASREDLQ